MPETALENVKRTIERRESIIKKGHTKEGARGYQFCSRDVLEEVKELSKIKNIDGSIGEKYVEVGMVNIRIDNTNKKSHKTKFILNDNITNVARAGKVYSYTKGKAVYKVNSENKIVFYPNTLVYQSHRRIGLNEDGSIADDMKCNDYNRKQLLNINDLFRYELDYEVEDLFFSFEFMCKTFFARGKMEKVIVDMIKHFKEGSGKDYRNDILTEQVKNNKDTKRYIQEVRKCIMDEIDKNKGNLNKMKYTYDNKEKNTLYNKIFRKIENPHFGSVSDIIDGFTIAINDTWGNMIEIVDFMLYKNQYAGKMKFTIYDHFGLNEPDVKKIYVQLAGFRAWFALQHLDKYKGKYKPFVTMITFEIPFFGVFDKL